jgi:hypothetical protein
MFHRSMDLGSPPRQPTRRPPLSARLSRTTSHAPKNRMHRDLEEYAESLSAWIESIPADVVDCRSPERGISLDSDPFESFALRLFTLQYRLNTPYRSLCQAMGVRPELVQSSADIPAVPAGAFKEFEMTCLDPAERTVVFHSSGTTAQRRSSHHHDARSLALYELSLRRGFRSHFPCADSGGDAALVSLTPPGSDAPHSSLVHMLETVGRTEFKGVPRYCGSVVGGDWVVDFSRLEREIRRLCDDHGKGVIAGTAFGFVHWLDHLEAAGTRFQLPEGCCVMETGGYKGRSRVLTREALHAGICHRLGVTPDAIVCEYGMSELSSQAYDGVAGEARSGGRRRLRFPPWCRARVVNPETRREVTLGEVGVLQLLDLANVASAMGVRTEDLARREADGFEWIGRAQTSEPRGCSLMMVDEPGKETR